MDGSDGCCSSCSLRPASIRLMPATSLGYGSLLGPFDAWVGGHGSPEMVPYAYARATFSLFADVEVAGPAATLSTPSCSTIVSLGELRISSLSVVTFQSFLPVGGLPLVSFRRSIICKR